jgi:cytochrome c peroxidase
VNTAFYPKLMWNGRFASLSGDPFDSSRGFHFPLPEGNSRFLPGDPAVSHLLVAQAHLPPTELVEVAGFTGTFFEVEPRFAQFDDGLGSIVPPPDSSGFRNEPIRKAVLAKLNANEEYRRLFGERFPAVAQGAPVDFTMFGRAIAEFEFSMVRADAPLDRFARGETDAMTEPEKRGALAFFGKGGCVSCHAVAGEANEMFSDFRMHVAAIPQLAPRFGLGAGNVEFDGPNQDEDFGLEQVTLDPGDRYAFRTSPLRNLAAQPAFFHNGAFTRLNDALRYHLDTLHAATQYDPAAAGVASDLRYTPAPIGPPLARLDPLLASLPPLAPDEIDDLAAFLETGLLDPGVLPRELCLLVPPLLPSGMRPLLFQDCAGVATEFDAP